jgi:hypothetical protein
MSYFFDFDHTLFDTDLFFHVDLRNALLSRLSVRGGEWDRTYAELLVRGYSIGDHLKALGLSPEQVSEAADWLYARFASLRGYVYADVVPTLEALTSRGAEIRILTFGDPAWQRFKVSGSGILEFAREVVVVPSRLGKATAIENSGECGENLVVVDNDPRELDQVRRVLPRSRTYWIRRPASQYLSKEGVEGRRDLEAASYREVEPLYSHAVVTDLRMLLDG